MKTLADGDAAAIAEAYVGGSRAMSASVDMAAIDRALGLDADTRAARDRLLAGLAGVRTEEQLWELYRGVAVPPGAPLVQLAETRRAIRWAVAACAQMVGDPSRLAELVRSVQEAGARELNGVLQGRVGQ